MKRREERDVVEAFKEVCGRIQEQIEGFIVFSILVAQVHLEWHSRQDLIDGSVVVLK